MKAICIFVDKQLYCPLHTDQFAVACFAWHVRKRVYERLFPAVKPHSLRAKISVGRKCCYNRYMANTILFISCSKTGLVAVIYVAIGVAGQRSFAGINGYSNKIRSLCIFSTLSSSVFHPRPANRHFPVLAATLF